MMTPSFKSPVRNLQRPSSMTSRMGGSWHTSINARELKFGTQVKNHNVMIHDVKNDSILQVSSQDLSKFLKYDFEDGGFLKHFY